jgi:hypothetical protein
MLRFSKYQSNYKKFLNSVINIDMELHHACVIWIGLVNNNNNYNYYFNY